MKNFAFGILLMFISFVNAQDSQELFNQANKEYQSEDYKNAIQSYESILDSGLESSEVYFNLGNAFYKTNKMADAIYYYEKALVLDPSNKDATTNLAYANRSIIDNIKTLPKSIFKKFNDTVLAIISYNTWAKLAVLFSLIAGGFWMLFFFSTQPAIKKMYFTLGVLVSIICVASLGITIQQYNQTINTSYAIVFSPEIEVKNAPRTSASETFRLHEGTKVKVIDQVGNWHKIKITDGQIGWIPEKTIKKL